MFDMNYGHYNSNGGVKYFRHNIIKLSTLESSIFFPSVSRAIEKQAVSSAHGGNRLLVV